MPQGSFKSSNGKGSLFNEGTQLGFAKANARQNPKNDQVYSKQKRAPATDGPCPRLCNLVPTDVPGPGAAQAVLHPRKDVFVLKVAKIGPNGDRKCKMELELVTPKGHERKPLCRVDTRETQCEPDPLPCCCNKQKKKN